MDEIDVLTWFVVKLLFLMGGVGFVAVLAILGGMLFYAGYVFGGLRRKERPMGHAKLDHIKYDILPDGTLGPGDNRNLEGPE
ncbi:MAG: hypothetical protein ACOVLE_07725 [Pirellula staleyi]|jgi:hypothetical protein